MRYFIELSYNGTNYHGWQKQLNANSVQAELTKVLKESCMNQEKGVTTFIEVILNQELGEPFRRDAMKKPVVVAGISKKDMQPQ